MHYHQLHIVPFLSGNPIGGKVLCTAGYVSVFRGAPNGIEACIEALRKPGGENAQVYVDSAQFIPSEHVFIGFSEKPALSGDQRRDSILGAMLVPEKIIVINEPFQGMSEDRREELARRLCEFAQQSGRIVIVTQLSDRPECWIENSKVARIDVTTRRRRTIGGGTNSRDLQKIVAQVREALQGEGDKDSGSVRSGNQNRFIVPLLAALLVSVIALWIQRHGERALKPDPVPVLSNVPVQTATAPTIALDPVLDDYPYTVKESIRQAFQGTDLAKIASVAASSVRSKSTEDATAKAQEFRIFMGPDGSTFMAPAEQPSSDSAPSSDGIPGMAELEARREQMRQKFLQDLAGVN